MVGLRLPHSPEHLVQAAFKVERGFQMEILEVVQPQELRSLAR